MINAKMTPSQRVIANRFYNLILVTWIEIVVASLFHSFVWVSVGLLFVFEICSVALIWATILLLRANTNVSSDQ